MTGVIVIFLSFSIKIQRTDLEYFCSHLRQLEVQVQPAVLIAATYKQTNEQIPWPESAKKLYRPSDCHLTAKLVTTFKDRRMLHSQRGGPPTVVILIF
jgi:hypothetical protein